MIPTAASDPAAVCPIATVCAGCQQIDHPYADQLTHKRQIVADALSRYPDLGGIEPEPCLPAARTTGYRTRAKLACARFDDQLRLGLYKSGGHDVIDVGDCPVLHPRLNHLAAAVRDVFTRPSFRDLTLTYVALRHSEHEAQSHITLVLSEDAPEEVAAAAAALMAEVGDLAGVTLNLNPGPPLRVFGPTFRHLVGRDRLVEQLGGREFELSPSTFFQANRDQAEAIVGLAKAELGTAPRSLVDLYAGVGVLGLSLAGAHSKVTLIEGYTQAADDARRAARRNDLSEVRVIGAIAERSADRLAAIGRADRVIVNPPRKGCAPEVLQAIARLAPERMLYVSCDPTTLARDLAHLRHRGLTATRIVPVDMLPQTDHIEVVAVLAATGDRPPLQILYEDGDLLALAKPGHLPVSTTTPGEPSLMSHLLALRGAATRGYVPIDAVDGSASGAILVAKNPEVGRRLTEQLGRGELRVRYCGLVRGVIRSRGTIERGSEPTPVRRTRVAKRKEATVACTRYRRLAVLRGHALVAITPIAGPPDGPRRHLAEIGHPLIGDTRAGHPPTNRHFAEKYAASGLQLHAAAITFRHPRTAAPITVATPIAGELRAVLDRLDLKPAAFTELAEPLAAAVPRPAPRQVPTTKRPAKQRS